MIFVFACMVQGMQTTTVRMTASFLLLLHAGDVAFLILQDRGLPPWLDRIGTVGNDDRQIIPDGIGGGERTSNLAPAQKPHDEIPPVFLAALLGEKLLMIDRDPGVLRNPTETGVSTTCPSSFFR